MKRSLYCLRIKHARFTMAAILLWGLTAPGISQTLPEPPVYLSGTNLIWNFTNGFSYAPFCVVATTNLSLPKTNWTYISTNQFDRWGSVRLVLPIEPDKARRFYCITLPVP